MTGSEMASWVSAGGTILAALVALTLGYMAHVREERARRRQTALARERAARLSAGFHHELQSLHFALDVIGRRLYRATKGGGSAIEAFDTARRFAPIVDIPLIERFIDQLEGFGSEQATRLTILYSALKQLKTSFLNDRSIDLINSEGSEGPSCGMFASAIADTCTATVHAGKLIAKLANSAYEFPDIPDWVENATMNYRVQGMRQGIETARSL